MGNQTKIDWADATWNPVTGCLHGCEYCYARKIAERFGGWTAAFGEKIKFNPLRDNAAELDRPMLLARKGKVINAPFPFGFTPTLFRYRLDEPQHWKQPKNIFVCSMADLFGDWVPDEWISAVFRACEAAQQHRYLFLTKEPGRFAELKKNGIQPPCGEWIGTSVTCDADAYDSYTSKVGQLAENGNMPVHLFASVEPLLEQLSARSVNHIAMMDWVIIGAETGNRHDKVMPEKSWVMEIANTCCDVGTPIFMKESLRGIMGDDFRQEFPWEKEDET